jgi:hypothetical protein
MNASRSQLWRRLTGWILVVMLLGLAAMQGRGIFRRQGAARAAVSCQPVSDAIEVVTAVARATNSAPGVPVGTSWEAIATTNLDSLAASLREAGWPGDVAAAVLMPMLLRQCGEELQRLPPQPFWLDHDARIAADINLFQARRAILLRYQERALQLTGRPLVPVEVEQGKSFVENSTIQALFRFLSGPLPEEKFRPFYLTLMGFERWSDECDSLPTIWEHAAQKEFQADLVRSFSQHLTQEELRTYIARCLAFKVAKDFKEVNPTPGELERICKAAAAAVSLERAMDSLDHDIEAEAEIVLEEAAIQTLGAARFATTLAEHDPEFKAIASELDGRSDRTDVLLRLRELRLSTRQELERIQLDFSHPLAERTAAAQGAKLQATAALRAILEPDDLRKLEGKQPPDWFYPGGTP